MIGGAVYLPQPQSLPQLHSFLSFIGQFFPVFLQLTFSAAKVVVHITAITIDNKIFTDVFITLALPQVPPHTSKIFQ
jgi:hypothetical protein